LSGTSSFGIERISKPIYLISSSLFGRSPPFAVESHKNSDRSPLRPFVSPLVQDSNSTLLSAIELLQLLLDSAFITSLSQSIHHNPPHKHPSKTKIKIDPSKKNVEKRWKDSKVGNRSGKEKLEAKEVKR